MLVEYLQEIDIEKKEPTYWRQVYWLMYRGFLAKNGKERMKRYLLLRGVKVSLINLKDS